MEQQVTNKFTALNDGMAIASVVMLVGSTAFAFLGAPRLDARLTEPAQPISIGAAGFGMFALSAFSPTSRSQDDSFRQRLRAPWLSSSSSRSASSLVRRCRGFCWFAACSSAGTSHGARASDLDVPDLI
jgi:hypothetical protein